jgi:hypothetical protein
VIATLAELLVITQLHYLLLQGLTVISSCPPINPVGPGPPSTCVIAASETENLTVPEAVCTQILLYMQEREREQVARRILV